jgi:hypothetical protein
MTTYVLKFHDTESEGSIHQPNNFTYADQATRKAVTGLSSGDLGKIAIQTSDASSWRLTGVSPTTWQAFTPPAASVGDIDKFLKVVSDGDSDIKYEWFTAPGVGTLDESYNAFGATPSTVVVDAAEGQGTTLKYDLNSAAADRYFDVDLANGKDATSNGSITYHTGFRVTNGSQLFGAYRNSSGVMSVDADIQVFNMSSFVSDFHLNANSSGNFLSINNDGTSPGTIGLNASSGVQSFVSVDAPINQSGTAGYNALLIDADVNAVGSGEQNLLNVQLAGSDRFRVNSEGNVRVGTGTPTSATGAGDFYVTGDIELGNNLYIKDNASVTLGTSSDVQIRYSTIQTPDSLLIGVGTDSNAAILCQKGDLGFDFAHGVAADPTLIGHSASQSTTEYWSLTHDKTHARMVTGAGAFCVGTGTPGVATGVGDLYVTGDIEADGNFYLGGTIPQMLSFGGGWGISSGTTANTGALIPFQNNQNPATWYWGTGATSNHIVIGEYADRTFDFAHGVATDPTLIGHSASQSTTEYWSLTHDKTHARMVTGAGAFCVGTGTPGVATGVGDLYVTGNVEVDVLIYADGGVQLGLDDSIGNNPGSFGAYYGRITSQTLDASFLTTGTVGNYLLFCEDADKGFDFAHGVAADPTLIGHSRNQSTTEWWSLTHNTTDIVLSGGAGALSLQPATGEVKLPDAGKVVYDNAPSSDLTASGDIVSATVDANATGIGAALYQKSNGAWAEAKADSLSTMPCRAVALETGTGTKKILRRNGWIRKDAFSLTTKGAPVYVSAATAGAFTHTKPSTTGDQVQIVGYIDDTNNVLDFNPSMTIVEVA